MGFVIILFVLCTVSLFVRYQLTFADKVEMDSFGFEQYAHGKTQRFLDTRHHYIPIEVVHARGSALAGSSA